MYLALMRADTSDPGHFELVVDGRSSASMAGWGGNENRDVRSRSSGSHPYERRGASRRVTRSTAHQPATSQDTESASVQIRPYREPGCVRGRGSSVCILPAPRVTASATASTEHSEDGAYIMDVPPTVLDTPDDDDVSIVGVTTFDASAFEETLGPTQMWGGSAGSADGSVSPTQPLVEQRNVSPPLLSPAELRTELWPEAEAAEVLRPVWSGSGVLPDAAAMAHASAGVPGDLEEMLPFQGDCNHTQEWEELRCLEQEAAAVATEPAVREANHSRAGTIGLACGIHNLGLTCYLNCALQLMFNTCRVASLLATIQVEHVDDATGAGAGFLLLKRLFQLVRGRAEVDRIEEAVVALLTLLDLPIGTEHDATCRGP